MNRVRWLSGGAVLLLTAGTLVACSEQGVMEVESFAAPRAPAFALVSNGGKVCSAADGTNMVVTNVNGVWAAPITGSVWVGKTATAGTVGRPRLGNDVYTTSFSVPAGATNIAISGNVLADNDVVINGGGGQILSTGVGPYPANTPDASSTTNFTTVGGQPFSRNTGFVAGSENSVTFTVYNDDDPNANGNPSGLSFCYTVTYTAAPTAVAVFVIGDVEPHAVGDVVNFWGSQWWKNNFMSGQVSNGVASFKGYAVNGASVCGGNWESLPGNSSNPPATIGQEIAVIVTPNVLKSGPNISGSVKEIVMVLQDGDYGPSPGHRGSGVVTKVVCK